MVSNINGKISYKMTLNVKDPVINVYKKECNTGISKSKIKKKKDMLTPYRNSDSDIN